MTSIMPPFHLAFPVRDIDSTRAFYVDVLGCRVGRSAERWIDFDFYGHQISAHVSEELSDASTNAVDGDDVPVRHFGLVLTVEAWRALVARLEEAGVAFLIAPRVRFAGEPGEQHTAFVCDPSGNAIELKAFADPARIFASE